jgi:membrane protein YqaA with SNARE-associated domain
MIADAASYGGLFLAAFLAATILPMQSEAALAGLILAGHQPVALLLLAASLGNVLGSLTNWLLGRFIDRFAGRRWFPASPAALARARRHYERWGHWSLLLSWLPMIGDPLTVVAGMLREPLWRFTLLVTIAKVGRYLILAWIVLRWN